MVFFNCNACGEALKKNQVEKHYLTKCRQCTVLSCVDCGKDFWGDEYQQHTKCISEEEKYSGKDWKPKPNANKGEAKQEAWIQQVQSAIDKSAVNPKLKKVLEQIKEYPNIPRKKAKFENFLRNSLRIWDAKLVTQVWDILEQEAQKNAKQPTDAKTNGESQESDASKSSQNNIDQTQAAAAEENNSNDRKLSKRERKEERRKEKNRLEKKDKRKQTEDEESSSKSKQKRKRGEGDGDELTEEAETAQPKKKKKKHKKHDEKAQEHEEMDSRASKGRQQEDENDVTTEQQEEEEDDSVNPGKFVWEAAIIGALKAATDNELSVKKLRKKVLAEYNARGGDGKTKAEEKLLAKFDKKINKNPRLKVYKDKVKLKH